MGYRIISFGMIYTPIAAVNQPKAGFQHKMDPEKVNEVSGRLLCGLMIDILLFPCTFDWYSKIANIQKLIWLLLLHRHH